MPDIIKLSDTTTGTTLLLNDMSAGWTYRLVEHGWKPRSVTMSPRTLGDPYDEVVEVMMLQVRGNTQAAVWEAIHKLGTVISSALFYQRGEAAGRVFLSLLVEGSWSANEQRALVLGPPNDRPAVTLPTTILKDIALGLYTTNVEIAFRTIPLFIGGGPGTTNTPSAAIAQGSVMTAAFTPAADVLAPFNITIGSFTAGGGSAPGPGVHVVVPTATNLTLIDSASFSTFTTPGAWATIADASAQGGNVRRYTPATTAPQLVLANVTGRGYRFAGFTMVRNNTVGRSYLLRAVAQVDGVSYYGQPIIVDDSKLTPQVVALGVVQTPKAPSRIGLEITPSATGGTIDVDLVLAAYLDTAPVSVTWFDKIDLVTAGITTGTWQLQYYHNTIGDVSAYAPAGEPSIIAYKDFINWTKVNGYGDLIIRSSGTSASSILLMPDGPYWCIGSGTRQNVSFSMQTVNVAGSPR